MTQTDFINYIDSFNRKKGEYTEEEILLIGAAHKQLDSKDKSWNGLASELGLDMNGESLRTKIWRKQTKSHLKETEKVGTKDEEDLLVTKKQELYIQQVKNQKVLNEYRKVLREEAKAQTFKQDLLCAVHELSELPVIKFEGEIKEEPETNVEAVLMFSDLHIGAKCDNFYNAYNYEIACKRVKQLVQETIRYCKRENVSVLNVVNLGDMIQGLIHTNARILQEFGLPIQIIKASELIAEALAELEGAAPTVTYRSCIDNHSRAVAKLEEHVEDENFVLIMDWYLKERLKGTKIQFLNDNIDVGIGLFDLMNRRKVTFAHGHEDTTNTSLQHFIGATEQFIHYVLLAHEHSEKLKVYQNVRVITNGSIIGTEEFALSHRLFNKPSQILLIFSNKNLLNISIELDIK